MSDQSALTIGEVINLLKKEFPDATVSKIRFLEDQGLIRPSRSQSGYRLFHENDLKRLRYILRQQRDHFLPLKVIKSKLTMWERGEEVQPDDGLTDNPSKEFQASQGEYGIAELARIAGIGIDHADALREHGLLTGDEPYDDSDVAIAKEAGVLIAYGLEPRHLRTIRIAAERSADLLGSLTAPSRRHRSPEARRSVQSTLAGGADALSKMYRLVLFKELRGLLEE